MYNVCLCTLSRYHECLFRRRVNHIFRYISVHASLGTANCQRFHTQCVVSSEIFLNTSFPCRNPQSWFRIASYRIIHSHLINFLSLSFSSFIFSAVCHFLFFCSFFESAHFSITSDTIGSSVFAYSRVDIHSHIHYAYTPARAGVAGHAYTPPNEAADPAQHGGSHIERQLPRKGRHQSGWCLSI